MKMFEVRAKAWVITFAILITYHLSLVTSTAQTFTQRVQQHTAGQGVVTIHHDKAIDNLVNGQATAGTPAKPAAAAASKPSTPTKQNTAKDKATADEKKEEGTANAVSVDTTVTASHHTMKVTGFRVQAFAGGNTRSDRQRAEHTGNVMRQLFPGADVYVRFYSPRWVCRVGNYRTYEEARAVLIEVRKQGYESATIVKGKIVVPID